MESTIITINDQYQIELMPSGNYYPMRRSEVDGRFYYFRKGNKQEVRRSEKGARKFITEYAARVGDDLTEKPVEQEPVAPVAVSEEPQASAPVFTLNAENDRYELPIEDGTSVQVIEKPGQDEQAVGYVSQDSDVHPTYICKQCIGSWPVPESFNGMRPLTAQEAQGYVCSRCWEPLTAPSPENDAKEPARPEGYAIVEASQQNCLRDYVPGEQFYVYGSPMRPMSAGWARIEGAVFVNADYRTDKVHTWIIVPYELDNEIVNYELTQLLYGPIVWQPENVQQPQAKAIARAVFTSLLGDDADVIFLDDPEVTVEVKVSDPEPNQCNECSEPHSLADISIDSESADLPPNTEIHHWSTGEFYACRVDAEDPRQCAELVDEHGYDRVFATRQDALEALLVATAQERGIMLYTVEPALDDMYRARVLRHDSHDPHWLSWLAATPEKVQEEMDMRYGVSRSNLYQLVYVSPGAFRDAYESRIVPVDQFVKF